MPSEQTPPVKKSGAGLRITVMLVVIAGVLGYFVVPNYLRKRHGEQMLGCRSNLKNIGTALDMYAKDHSGAFPEKLEPLIPDYLVKRPVCPSAGESTYQLAVGPEAPRNESKEAAYYYVACAGHHHGNAGLPQDRPAYTSIEGVLDQD